MSDAAYQIAHYLEDEGVGTVGTNIFIDAAPAPDNKVALEYVAVYNEGGRSPLVGTEIEQPHIVVLIFGDPTKRMTTWAKAETIKGLLHDVGNLELFDSSADDGYKYILIRLRGHPSRQPKDEHNRTVIRMAFAIMRTSLA